MYVKDQLCLAFLIPNRKETLLFLQHQPELSASHSVSLQRPDSTTHREVGLKWMNMAFLGVC